MACALSSVRSTIRNLRGSYTFHVRPMSLTFWQTWRVLVQPRKRTGQMILRREANTVKDISVIKRTVEDVLELIPSFRGATRRGPRRHFPRALFIKAREPRVQLSAKEEAGSVKRGTSAHSTSALHLPSKLASRASCRPPPRQGQAVVRMYAH
jgi:hypothetical protein